MTDTTLPPEQPDEEPEYDTDFEQPVPDDQQPEQTEGGDHDDEQPADHDNDNPF